MKVLGVIGFIAGAIIGFLLRPSAFLIGQLPLKTVIMRGTDLKGLDKIMVPVAERSFNLMFGVAVVGMLIGIAIGYYMEKSRKSKP